jgi:hypothetical protein
LGYLRSLLQELRVPETSQLLVFSKTSCQRERISPKSPRAVYFNDQADVAFIPGSPFLEVSGVDPNRGAVFYTLEQKETAHPRLVRRDQCLECHTSSQTLNVPGYLVRSYATDGNGVIDITDGCSMVDQRTPLAERWGGWYVCGTSAPLLHRGNLIGNSTAEKQSPDAVSLGNAAQGLVADTSKYLRISSDIVAIMVLEHQAQMQNLITRLRDEAVRRPSQASESPAEKAASDALLRYLLFADEVELDRPIQGTPGFTAAFEAQGPMDKEGRSLRQFDLQTRLFKYPCSYMVYSDAFDALPRDVRLHLYRRLWRVLTGAESDPSLNRLSPSAKRAALEILVETKRDIPIDWKL